MNKKKTNLSNVKNIINNNLTMTIKLQKNNHEYFTN